MMKELMNVVIEKAKAAGYDQATCEEKNTTKNNGTIKKGLVLKLRPDSTCSAVMYPSKDVFASREAMERFANLVIHESKSVPDIQFDKLMNLDPANITAKLVNAAKNEDLLKDVPHRMFDDLALTYRNCVHVDGDEMGSVIITNRMMNEIYKVTEEELFAIAIENLTRELEVVNMADIIGIPPEMRGDSPTMIVVMSRKMANGAACILTPLAKDILDEWFDHGEYYIVPSSIHEMFAIEKLPNCTPQDLMEMIIEVNGNTDVIAEEEVLSDHPYCFDKDGNLVTAA